MTREEADQYLANLSDDELRDAVARVKVDLAEAAQHQPQSERHSECFAAAMLFAGEVQRRGMVIKSNRIIH